uniref:Reverse transcriptase N-terminal domain-containing protein n=1 Tax=Caloglossa intermedia TaxID=100879 RepID=A0A1Z1M6E5_9FLOR|nr:hypothetical protein [Caloglossa intermedia]ARW61433.1 hypothetical protein [Caloglossa intermedia]
MLYTYNLNIETSWSSLPWKKIYTKITAVQQKIYKAAKRCEFSKMYRLQEYLLNTNECKIVSINSTVEKIHAFYFLQYKKNLSISNKEKFQIFKNLYSSKINCNKNIFFLIEEIKRYITYLSIKPEYLAKFVYTYSCYKKILKNKSLNYTNFFFNRYKKIAKTKKLDKKLLKIDCYKYKYSNEIYLFIINIYFCYSYWYKLYVNKLYVFSAKKRKTNSIHFLLSLKKYNYNKYIKNIFFLNISDKLVKFNNATVFSEHNLELFCLQFNKTIYYKLKKKYNNIFFKYKCFIFNSKHIHKDFHTMQLGYIYINYCI